MSRTAAASRVGGRENRRWAVASRGIAILLIALLLGVDPGELLQGDQAPAPRPRSARPRHRTMPGGASWRQVLGETEEVWRAEFAAAAHAMRNRRWCCSRARRSRAAASRRRRSGRSIARSTGSSTSTATTPTLRCAQDIALSVAKVRTGGVIALDDYASAAVVGRWRGARGARGAGRRAGPADVLRGWRGGAAAPADAPALERDLQAFCARQVR